MEQTAHADERLIFLIEKATAIAGSQAKLARMLDIPGQHVTNWLSGYRTCTPEDRARLAGMCGLDANQELIRAIIEKHEGTKKGDDLRHFLGKSLLAIGAAVASSGASAAAIFSTTQALSGLDALLMLLSTMYIMSNIRRRTNTQNEPSIAALNSTPHRDCSKGCASPMPPDISRIKTRTRTRSGPHHH